MNRMTIILFAFFAIIGLAIIGIVAMLISIGKAGDERRKHIIGKASGNTFLIIVGILIISIIENLVRVLAFDTEIHRLNPFVFLTIIAVVYATQLVFYKKKFGD